MMSLLNAQNNFYIEFICRRACDEKIQVLTLCLWLVSRPLKSGCFFGKFTVEQVLKSFSGRNSFLKSSVFGFYNTLSYDLEKSKELRALISWVLGL